MKTLHTLAAITLACTALLSGPAMAADTAAPAASGPTRAEVKAEVAKARADGTLTKTPNQDIQAITPKETKRHQKRREAKEAKAKAKAEAASAATAAK